MNNLMPVRSGGSSPDPKKLLYSRKEAATFLSLSIRAVDYLRADGRLKPRRIGGRVLFTHQELCAFGDGDDSQSIVPQ